MSGEENRIGRLLDETDELDKQTLRELLSEQRPGQSGKLYKDIMDRFKKGFPPRNVLGPIREMSVHELDDIGVHAKAASHFLGKTWDQVIDKIDPANISPVKLQKFLDAYMKLYHIVAGFDWNEVRKLASNMESAMKELATK